jgi:hypothetical protein
MGNIPTIVEFFNNQNIKYENIRIGIITIALSILILLSNTVRDLRDSKDVINSSVSPFLALYAIWLFGRLVFPINITELWWGFFVKDPGSNYVRICFENIMEAISVFLYPLLLIIYFLFVILTEIYTIFNIERMNLGTIFGNSSNVFFSRYAPLYLAIALVGITFYIFTQKPEYLTKNNYVFIIMSFPIILALLYAIPIISTTKDLQNMIFNVAIGLLFLLAIFYYYTSMNKDTISVLFLVINVLLIINILFALAIFFYLFSNYFKSLNGWTGFFTYLVFYIPCLIIDFVAYIKNEFALTSNIVYLLFVVEIAGILLYNYLPQLIQTVANSGSLVLLKDSMFLDSRQVIGTSDQFIMPPTSNIDRDTLYRTNYAVSMWIYVNGESNNQLQETAIFNYGDGNPAIHFISNIDNGRKMNVYKIHFSNNSKNAYEITAPSQKWNNFVFNYSSSQADLFINGNLEKTFVFADDLPSYNSYDMMTVGSNNGINGAICNVRYYTKTLGASQIANNYNLLMGLNPPIA